MDMKEVGRRVHDTTTGIYYGFTMLNGTIYPAVVSVGWNPYFDNEEKTVVCIVCCVDELKLQARNLVLQFPPPPVYHCCC